MKKYEIVIIVSLVFISVSQTPAFGHRDGCHAWHSCPSDHGTYECGDTGHCSECPDNNYCQAGMSISITTDSTPSSPIQTNSSVSDQQVTNPQDLSTVPEFPISALILIIAIFSIIFIPKMMGLN